MDRKWRDQTIIFDLRRNWSRHCNCVTVNATGDRAVPQTHTSGRYGLYPLARSSSYRYRALRWSRWSADLSRRAEALWESLWEQEAAGWGSQGAASSESAAGSGRFRGTGAAGLRPAVESGVGSKPLDRRIDRIPLDPVVARSCVAGALVRVAMVVRFCCMIRVSPRVPVCPVFTFVSNAPISPGVFRFSCN